MNNDRVVDGLGGFSVVGGVVRFELLSLKTLEGDLTQRNSMEVSERLAMSLPAFLNFYQGLTRVVGELEAKGVISRNPDATSEAQVVSNSPNKKGK